MAGGWGKVEACVSVSATTWLKKWQKEGTFFASLFSLSEKYIGKGWQYGKAHFSFSGGIRGKAPTSFSDGPELFQRSISV